MTTGATEPICIAGPTASGKTAAALAVAAHVPCEIISVDSALVYRGMDIGTAKPSAAERAQVPHHLIDIRDPRETYSAAQFVADATPLIHDIRTRGRLPLLVGGTMLYFKALFEGLDDMPAADAAVRAELEAQARERGWPAMHAELAQVDPVTAARLAPNDSQRIQRALEVWRITGQALSSLHRRRPASGARSGSRVASPDRLISLEPRERTWLHERIAQRFDAMLEQGLVDEVKALRARGDLSPELPSMRCVGYRQAWEWLDAADTADAAAPQPADVLRQRGIEATRQLAKRQITWLRSMPARTVIDSQLPDASQRVLQQVQAWCSTSRA